MTNDTTVCGFDCFFLLFILKFIVSHNKQMKINIQCERQKITVELRYQLKINS